MYLAVGELILDVSKWQLGFEHNKSIILMHVRYQPTSSPLEVS